MLRRARVIVTAAVTLLVVVACSDPSPTDPATSAPATGLAADHLLSPDAPGPERTVLDRLAPGPGRLHILSSRADPEELGPGLAHYTTAPPRPGWHFLAADFEEGLPVGLRYTELERWPRLLASLPPYMPKPLNVEVTAIRCDDGRTSLDEHLQDIEVPIFHLGAGGAEGQAGEHTPTLTSSDDVTAHIVSVSGDPAADFGHVDLFMARNAPELAGDPLAEWLTEL